MARYKLSLTVLSPVHIGTADGEIGPMEFFVNNDHVYLASEKSVMDALAEEGLIDNFVDFVENEWKPTLGRFLNTLTGKQRANIEKKIIVRKIPLENTEGRISKIRLQVSNTFDGLPCIPGSSIKGALRVALLFLLCRDNDGELKRVVRKLWENNRIRKERFAAELDKKLLQNVKLSGTKEGPHTDWLKCLYVSDAYPDTKNCTEVIPVKVISLTDDKCHFGARGATIYVEAITPGTTFTCDVIVDDFMEDMLSRFSKGLKAFDFERLLNGLPEKFDRLLKVDRGFFETAGLPSMAKRHEMLRKWGANFRLGWGSGLLTMTLDLLLTDEERRKLRERFYPRRNNPNFPQSRKIVVNNRYIKGKSSGVDDRSVVDTFGWINLKWERII